MKNAMMLGALTLLAVAVATAVAAPSRANNVSTQAAVGYWYVNVDHTGDYRGRAPWVDDPENYQVFKSVNSGDGNGIQDAIDSGGRHEQWLASEPRVVYLASGTYEVSTTINLRTDTILMGDATNPPVMKAAAGFNGDVLLNGKDPSVGESGEISFSVGVKNIILDTTAVDAGKEHLGSSAFFKPVLERHGAKRDVLSGSDFSALYWGVAQVCQLSNLQIKMPKSQDGKGHSGIKLGRGSTLGLADIRIENGRNGIWHNGHQQAFYKSIYFFQNNVGMLIDGGNTITILDPIFEGVNTAVKHTGGYPFIGLVDAKSIKSGVTYDSNGYASVLIENLDKDTDDDIVRLPTGTALGKASHVDTFTYGNTVGRSPVYGETTTHVARPEAVAPGRRIPAVAAPTYGDQTADGVINIKDPSQNGGHTVHGNGKDNDVEALTAALQYAVRNNKIAYFPFGDYRVESTLTIPVGSRIVGEAWSTISAAGDVFKKADAPKPVVQVGVQGDVGVIQIQDMRFTVAEILPGAVIVEINAAGNKPGDVGLWNLAITVGGTRGASGLTDNCRDASNPCQAAYLGMHFTQGSSAYVENVWNWAADHITEGFSGGSSIAGKGGALVESTKGTWLHALGVEHWWLYQLNLRNAENVVVSMLQTETNYEQGANAHSLLPRPWTADKAGWGDPDYAWCGGGDGFCRMGLSNYVNGGSNVYYYGSASWAFFNGPNYQRCTDSNNCQEFIHWIEKTPENLQSFGWCAKDSRYALRLADATNINTNPDFAGSWGSLVGRYTP